MSRWIVLEILPPDPLDRPPGQGLGSDIHFFGFRFGAQGFSRGGQWVFWDRRGSTSGWVDATGTLDDPPSTEHVVLYRDKTHPHQEERRHWPLKIRATTSHSGTW